jgi:ABC-type molybdate transport system permease subunit
LLSALRDVGPSIWRRRAISEQGPSTLFRVTIPMIYRGLVSAFMFTLVLASGDYVAPQVLGGTSGMTVGLLISNQFRQTGNWPFGAAHGLHHLRRLRGDLHRRRAVPALCGARAQPTLSLRRRKDAARLCLALCRDAVRSALPDRPVQLPQFTRTDLPDGGVQPDVVREAVFGRRPRQLLQEQPDRRDDQHSCHHDRRFDGSACLARLQGWARAAFGAITFAPIALPGLFVGIALLTLFAQLGVNRSLVTVTMAHVLISLPFFIEACRSRLEYFDLSLEEAARDLGASAWDSASVS